MTLPSMAVHPDIKTKLGDQVLADVARNLWPQDCQSCNKPLGTQPPSLCIDVDPSVTMATLHHTTCQTSSWNDLYFRASSNLSWRSRMIDWALGGTDDQPDIWPTFLVNPHLEAVRLRQDDAGAWQVATMDYGRELGLATAGPDFIIDRPVRAHDGHTPTARLRGSTVEVHLSPFEHWAGTFEKLYTTRVRERGGVMLAYTTAIHPQQLTSYQEFIQPVARREVAFGFIPLAR